MSDTVIIVNEAAGGGRGARSAAAQLDAYATAVNAARWVTDGPGHATELARKAAQQQARLVVAAGGDGTVFEVVNGLLDGGQQATPALGLLPIGTGNSFVRDLGLQRIEDAVDALKRGETRQVDAVRLTHADGVLYYINLLSIGFSAHAGALTNRRYKGLGTVGYILAVLQSLLTLRTERVPHRCDDGGLNEEPHTLVSFSNSRYTGGDMMMAPAANVSDGLLDVVRIGTMGRRRFLFSFPRIFAGTHPDMPEVSVEQAHKVVFPDPVQRPLMIDGEVLDLVLKELEVIPGALSVVA